MDLISIEVVEKRNIKDEYLNIPIELNEVIIDPEILDELVEEIINDITKTRND